MLPKLYTKLWLSRWLCTVAQSSLETNGSVAKNCKTYKTVPIELSLVTDQKQLDTHSKSNGIKWRYWCIQKYSWTLSWSLWEYLYKDKSPEDYQRKWIKPSHSKIQNSKKDEKRLLTKELCYSTNFLVN